MTFLDFATKEIIPLPLRIVYLYTHKYIYPSK